MLQYLLLLLLSVGALLPLGQDWVNEEEVAHVECEQGDDDDDHDDHDLDDDGVPLFIPTHTSRTEGFWYSVDMVALNIETWNYHILTVAVTERKI